MRPSQLVVISFGLLLALPSVAERRLTLAYHGLRFLGLDDKEQKRYQDALQQSLQHSKKLDLVSSGTGITAACGGKIYCHCRAAREEKAARAVFGNIGRIGQIYSLELVLVEAQSCTVENSIFVTEAHESLAAASWLASLVTRLTTPLESVSETVVKDEQNVDAVPAMVTVFTAKQIRQLGITRLEELFRLVPGFEVLEANWGSNVLHLGLPGTILYLIDGTPLFSPMANYTTLGKDIQIPLHHIDRVEFVRGPGSVLWGANAFLGMVNFIPHMPSETTPRITAEASYGTYGSVDLFASAEQSHRWFRYHLSTNLNLESGPQSFVRDSIYGNVLDGEMYPDRLIWNNGGTTDNDMDRNYDIVAKLEIAQRLQFTMHHINHQVYYEISPFGSLLPADAHGRWEKWHRLYELAWEDKLPWGLRYRLSGSRYEHRFWENYVIHPPNEAVLERGLRALQGNEVEPEVSHLVEARLYHNIDRDRWTNQILVGTSFMHQQLPDTFTDLIGVLDPPPKPSLDLARQTFRTFSGFFQENLSLWRWLYLSGGVRLEQRNPYGLVLSSQGGLVASLPYVQTKLIYAEGFRPPEANQLYSQVGVEGNMNLRPEKSRAVSMEVGTQLGPIRLKAGGTAAWVSDQIVLNQDPQAHSPGFTSKPYNSGSTTIYAGYGEVRVEWLPMLSSFVNYNYKWVSESEPTGTGLAVAPHTAAGGLSLRPINDLSFFVTSSLISPRTVSALAPGSQPISRQLPTTANLNMGLWLTNLFEKWDLGLKIINPFGFTYDSPYSVTGNPNYIIEKRNVRAVFFTLRWSSTVELAESKPLATVRAPASGIPTPAPPSPGAGAPAGEPGSGAELPSPTEP